MSVADQIFGTKIDKNKIVKSNYAKKEVVKPVFIDTTKTDKVKKMMTPIVASTPYKQPKPTLLDKVSTYISPAEIKKRELENNKKFLGVKVADKLKTESTLPYSPNKGDAALYSALKSSGMGLVTPLLPKYKQEQGEESIKKYPIAGNIGAIGGYASPGTSGAKLIKPLVSSVVKKTGSKLLGNAVEGAIVGTGITATENVIPVLKGEKTLKQASKDIGTGLLTGAALDTAFYGLGKLAKPIINKIRLGQGLSHAEKIQFAKATNTPFKDVGAAIDKANLSLKRGETATQVIAPNIRQELGLPRGTTSKDFSQSQVQLAKDIEVDNYYKQFEPEKPIVKPLVAENKIVKPLVGLEAPTQVLESSTQIVKPPVTLKNRYEIDDTINIMGDNYLYKGEINNGIRVVDQKTGKETIIPNDFAKDAKLIVSGKRTANMTDRTTQFNGKLAENKAIKLYQVENPQVVPFYKNKVKELITDIEQGTKGEDIFIRDGQTKDLLKTTGSPRFTSSTMARILDSTGAKYEDIHKTLIKMANGTIAKNHALAKRIEMFIDDDLVHGYTLADGTEIPKNNGYIQVRNKIEPNKIDIPEFMPKNLDTTHQNQLNFAMPNENVSMFDTPLVKPLVEQTIAKGVEPVTTQPKSVAMDIEKPVVESLTVPVDEKMLGEYRRTIHNSLMKSEVPEELKKAFEADPQLYQKVNNEEDWGKAWVKVSQDPKGTKEALSSKHSLSSADDTMEYIALIHQTSKTNIAEAKKLSEELAEKATRSGQAIQAIVALQKTTPEGKLMQAVKSVKKSEDALKESNPGVYNNFKEESNVVSKKIETAKEEISNELETTLKNSNDTKLNKILNKSNVTNKSDLTPEQMLANKIDNAITVKKTPKDIDLINEMVNELFGKAKPKLKLEPQLPLNLSNSKLSNAVKSKQEYARVWQASKDILKYQLDPTLYQQIDDFVNQGVRPVFNEKTLSTLINKTMKDNDINLNELVKKFSTNQITDRNLIKADIIKSLGLEGEDAEYLSRFIEKELKMLIKDKKEQILKSAFPEKKAKTEFNSKIEGLVNVGALENNKYKSLFINKMPDEVRNVLKNKNIKIDDLVRLSRDTQLNVTDDVVADIMNKLDIDIMYYDEVSKAATDTLNAMNKKRKDAIVKQMLLEQPEPTYKALRIRINELYNLDAINDLTKAKYKIQHLSDADAEWIVKETEKANMLDGRQKEIALAQVDQFIADKTDVSVGDKVRALRNIALLANPKTTLVRNPLGNAIFSGLENISHIPSGLTDAIVSKALKTTRTTNILPDIKTQASGFKKGVSQALEDAKLGIDTSPVRGYAELPRNKKIFELAMLNKANNWLGTALSLGDRPFYQAAHDARLKELMKFNPNMAKEDAEKLALEFGVERTFQNNSATAKAMSALKKNVLNLGKDFGAGDIIMPYTQTPANILEKGIQYTPLNLINIAKKLGGQATGRESIRNDTRAFTDAVGRTFTGSGLIALGYSLAKNGHITGTQKNDSSKEKAIKKQAGEQAYSIKIGDKWVSYDWAQPASMPLAIGVDSFFAGEDEQSVINAIEKGTIGGIETLINQGMLQGVLRTFGGSSPVEGFAGTVAQFPSQFIPSLSRQSAQQSDKYKRDIDYTNMGTELKTTIQRGIPVLRQQLPESIDMFGEKILEQGGKQGISKALNVFLNPSLVSNASQLKVTNEIYDLYKKTGESDVIPSKMPDGLDTKQKREFKITFGKSVGSSLSRLINSSAYANASDVKRVKMISREINDQYEKTKDKMKLK